MIDLEKVIRGLEAHCETWDEGKLADCIKNPDMCPYRRGDRPGCTAALAADALALLKEQEARVMSFNELKFDTVYWIELKDVMPWPVAMAKMCGNPENLVFVDYHGDKWDVSKYRIKEGGWRCWTSRPTPDQMRDTPWEGEEESK